MSSRRKARRYVLYCECCSVDVADECAPTSSSKINEVSKQQQCVYSAVLVMLAHVEPAVYLLNAQLISNI